MHSVDDDLERVHRLNEDDWLSSYQPVYVIKDNAEDVRRDKGAWRMNQLVSVAVQSRSYFSRQK